jgi:hypothetical protein
MKDTKDTKGTKDRKGLEPGAWRLGLGYCDRDWRLRPRTWGLEAEDENFRFRVFCAFCGS